MSCDKPLSNLYLQYRAGKLAKKDFEGSIFQYLLDNFERFRFYSENQERWNDFLSWLYPRIVRAIELYRDVGSSFDAYIAGLIHSAAREYRNREIDHCMTEYICWKARAEEILFRESEPEYVEQRKDASIPNDINPRQVLFLLLKSYFLVSDEFVAKVAKAIGMDVAEVQQMIDELRKRRSLKEAEFLSLRERIHCQHYRCLTYQKRMMNIQPGSDYYDKVKDRFERAKRRYLAMRKRLRSMRIAASNRMVADVMGVPRGTVDSGLFSIRNRFGSLLAQTDLTTG